MNNHKITKNIPNRIVIRIPKSFLENIMCVFMITVSLFSSLPESRTYESSHSLEKRIIGSEIKIITTI